MTLREKFAAEADVRLPTLYMGSATVLRAKKAVAEAEGEEEPKPGDPEEERKWDQRRLAYRQEKRRRILLEEEEARRRAEHVTSSSSSDYGSDDDAYASDVDLDLVREGGRTRTLQLGVKLSRKQDVMAAQVHDETPGGDRARRRRRHRGENDRGRGLDVEFLEWQGARPPQGRAPQAARLRGLLFSRVDDVAPACRGDEFRGEPTLCLE